MWPKSNGYPLAPRRNNYGTPSSVMRVSLGCDARLSSISFVDVVAFLGSRHYIFWFSLQKAFWFISCGIKSYNNTYRPLYVILSSLPWKRACVLEVDCIVNDEHPRYRPAGPWEVFILNHSFLFSLLLLFSSRLLYVIPVKASSPCDLSL